MVDWDLRPIEGKIPYEASRWQTLDVLLDIEELRELFLALPPFYLYKTSGKNQLPKVDDKEEWLAAYEGYQKEISLGSREREATLSAFMADSPLSLYGLMTPSKKILIRPKSPVVQIAAHAFSFSEEEGNFYSQIHGIDSIPWGIHVAFPLLFEDPATKEVKKLTDPDECPSLRIYKGLQGWLREHSAPVRFLFQEKKVIAPFRVGRKAKVWAKDHPQLQQKGLVLL